MIRPNAFDTSWMTNAISSLIMWAGYRSARCLSASRRDSPDSRSPSRSTSARTQSGSVRACWRSAQPIALRSQNDGSSTLASTRAGAGRGRFRSGGRPGRSRRYAAARGRRRSPSARTTGVAAERWSGQHVADQVGGHVVDDVPPGAGHDQVLARASRLAGSSHARARGAGRPRSRRTTPRGGWPRPTACARWLSHCSSVGRLPVPQQRPEHGLEAGCRQAAVGHRGLHVGLLLGRHVRVPRRRESAAYGLDEHPVCGGGVGHPPQTRAPRTPRAPRGQPGQMAVVTAPPQTLTREPHVVGALRHQRVAALDQLREDQRRHLAAGRRPWHRPATCGRWCAGARLPHR